MKPEELERFRRIEEIFAAALERPPGPDRDDRVRALVGDDEHLGHEVAQLLENHERIRAARNHPDFPPQ